MDHNEDSYLQASTFMQSPVRSDAREVIGDYFGAGSSKEVRKDNSNEPMSLNEVSEFSTGDQEVQKNNLHGSLEADAGEVQAEVGAPFESEDASIDEQEVDMLVDTFASDEPFEISEVPAVAEEVEMSDSTEPIEADEGEEIEMSPPVVKQKKVVRPAKKAPGKRPKLRKRLSKKTPVQKTRKPIQVLEKLKTIKKNATKTVPKKGKRTAEKAFSYNFRPRRWGSAFSSKFSLMN